MSQRIMYAVTVRVDGTSAGEWLQWMKAVHVPAVLATGCFSRCTIQREEVSPGDAGISFLLEYLAHSPEALRRYQQDHAPALQQVHSTRYQGRFTASRAIRTVIEELSTSLA
jgi:hypothetical protein